MQTLNQYLRLQADARIYRDCLDHFQRIYPVPGGGKFNYRCYYNAVEMALADPDRYDVIECIYNERPTGWSILHYVVYDNVEQCYIDNTLGHFAQNNDYYRIRSVPQEYWLKIESIFSQRLLDFKKKYVPWWQRPFIDRVV